MLATLSDVKLYPVGNITVISSSIKTTAFLICLRAVERQLKWSWPSRCSLKAAGISLSRQTGNRRKENRKVLVLMGFSWEAWVTVNQQDEDFGQSLKCAGEATTTQLCPIRGKLEKLVLCVRQGAQWVGGRSVERKGSDRLITLEGSFTFHLQRQTLSLCWEVAVTSQHRER